MSKDPQFCYLVTATERRILSTRQRHHRLTEAEVVELLSTAGHWQS